MSRIELSVHDVALPGEASIASLYSGSHLADAYAVRLPADAPREPERLARFLFASPPRWVAALMRLRDALVGGFGLKTCAQLQDAGAAAQERHVGIFKIYSRSAREIVLGEDDSHLDFRIALLCRGDARDGAATVVVATVVHCHNRLGRIYIRLIAPFHRLIVRDSLRRAARAGWRER